MWGAEIIRGVQQAARKHRVGVVLSEFGPRDNAKASTASRFDVDEFTFVKS